MTHVDGSGRVQIVNCQANPLYWRLLKAFEKATDVPVLLNTSFNENEPIVHSPKEAVDCFLRTQMDVLVMGRVALTKVNVSQDTFNGLDKSCRNDKKRPTCEGLLG